MEKAMLFDSSKCIACRACQSACKQWWELPSTKTTNRGNIENPPELGPETWNKINFHEFENNGTLKWQFTRQACMQCTTAVCVWVCPTYALVYSENGHIDVNYERCIGCGRCVEFCPFEIPKLGSFNVTPRISVNTFTPRLIAYKCIWCQDRLKAGLVPACVKTCPTEALQFGERSEIVELAKIRIAFIQGKYPNANLYGEDILGGLHVLYVLTESPRDHGLPLAPEIVEYPPFDPSNYPDWYFDAIKEGELSIFPNNAKREWYMEPDLTPL